MLIIVFISEILAPNGKDLIVTPNYGAGIASIALKDFDEKLNSNSTHINPDSQSQGPGIASITEKNMDQKHNSYRTQINSASQSKGLKFPDQHFDHYVSRIHQNMEQRIFTKNFLRLGLQHQLAGMMSALEIHDPYALQGEFKENLTKKITDFLNELKSHNLQQGAQLESFNELCNYLRTWFDTNDLELPEEMDVDDVFHQSFSQKMSRLCEKIDLQLTLGETEINPNIIYLVCN